MDLERVSVVMRPRGPWEAMDLGLALLHRHRRLVWTTLAMTALPVFVVVWALFYRWPWLAFGILWWLKPVFDRVPLAILSEALFGGTPTPRSVLRGLRASLRPHQLRALTLSRLSPSRSFLLPIWQLEGHGAASVLRRERVLGRSALGPAMTLTAVCAALEQVFILSGLSLIFLFMPENLEMDAMGVLESVIDGVTPAWFSVALGVVHALAVAFVEPVYVAAGFGLYVNRRMLLEGWDVELGFRRLVKRLAPALALLLALGLGAEARAEDTGSAPEAVDAAPVEEAPVEEAPVEPVQSLVDPARVAEAAERAGAPIDASALGAEADTILTRPEFPHKEKRFSWKIPEQPTSSFNFNLPFGPFLAMVARVLAFVALGVGLALLVRALLRLRRGKGGAADAEDEAPDEQVRLPALLADVGTLPEDVAAVAWRWWREGRHAEALGLLYRAALLDLVKLRGVALAEGDTESDCLIAARPGLPPVAWTYLEGLTLAWQGAAYAHRLPSDEAARGLCEAWPLHFRRAP